MPLAVGQLLQNRYRILRLLGQGGMGAVYLAEDTRLGRLCAVKENLPDPSADPQVLAQMRRQFQAEARILATLDHPNLPKVYDFFSDAGNEYMVMEYVEGDNLATLLQRQGGPLPERPVLLWADQVLDALEELHGQQPRPIIHRDIKPANIILTAKGRIKLVDFGLVKLFDPGNPGTATAMKGMGTPEYAPLEQYGKGAGHTDARSDIYSLGATLYHLLTGVAPPEVTQRILDPRKLAPPRQHNPALSSATEAAVLRAMEVHPDQRWQMAAAFRQALTAARAPATTLIATPAARATAIANVLPALRPLTDRFGIELVYVPAGEFIMGSTDAQVDAAFALCRKAYGNCERRWFENELPQHRATTAAFWIGKTEITNAQYRPFVEAGGYRDRSLWTAAGWQWREGVHVTQPGCWDDEQWNKPDYPVVCVSWYEALAYAHWLARETGLPVRLPTEAEWEKAARGSDGRTWPWGEGAPDGTRLNYCDVNCEYGWKDSAVDDGYRYTAPAGSYPAGASPYGALDMAGNVWEWTSSLYKNYPYRSDDGRENLEGSECCRVVRGGAWLNHLVDAHPAVRVKNNPNGRYDYIGVRLVVAP